MNITPINESEALAFVGLIDEDPAYLIMAARMALSASHCETWTESIMGCLPGATWHHRSFTEEIYCRACGLVLDWAGSVLSPHAKQLIADAIIMKGLPRIESDFKRMEYIREMNQGIAFSSGRIIGALALLDLYPRYSSLVDEAERDLHEMIDNYVHDDGGTLEGMGYWTYTFSTAMPLMWALARHRNQSMGDYATETLKRTGAYGLGMVSTVGSGRSFLAINDAHLGVSCPGALAASFGELTVSSQWSALARATMEDKILKGIHSEKKADIYQFIMTPEVTATEHAPTWKPLADRSAFFPEVGQFVSVRDGILFNLCSGPTYSPHYHMDKGSFSLEAGKEFDAPYRCVCTHAQTIANKSIAHLYSHQLPNLG